MKSLICELKKVGFALNETVRPFLTFFISAIYNIILGYACLSGSLSVNDYIVAVGPTNAMIIGFWFAEKAALRDPKISPEPKNRDAREE